MRVIQAVYGVFHHFELAHQLHARKHLRCIYSTWPWMRLKREGLPILNSHSGLRALATGNYKRPLGFVTLVERDRAFECCWGREDEGVCAECGYGFIAELACVLALKPSAILQAMRIFS